METDPNTEPVQAPADDGAQGGGGTEAPYAEYLNRIPEEVRGQVEPVFKEWDANTTRRFQEHADFRKSWEPLQETGINQFSPEEVGWLAQFRQALNEPEQIQRWYESYAQQNGLTPEAPPAEPPPDDLLYGESNAQLEQLLNKALGPVQQRLESFAAWQQQQEQGARLAEAERFVSSQIEELKAKHPQEFNEAAVEKLVAQYIETDPRNAVQRAFSDWQAIRSQLERDTFQSKVDAPPPAEHGGVADGSPEEVHTLAQAAEIAKTRLRQARLA